MYPTVPNKKETKRLRSESWQHADTQTQVQLSCRPPHKSQKYLKKTEKLLRIHKHKRAHRQRSKKAKKAVSGIVSSVNHVCIQAQRHLGEQQDGVEVGVDDVGKLFGRELEGAGLPDAPANVVH